MPGLADTVSRLSQLRGRFPSPPASTRLSPLSFAPNPGALDALWFVPDDLPAGAPLVVVLHGCTQSAAGYDAGTGWSRLAERHGFAVLFPEQRRENNANLCFNWFSPEDVTRGSGEVASIKSMIDAAIRAHRLDPARVFITGLSAGGAMTSAMLATYPEVFAAGTVIAGLPYGVAHNIPDAFAEMRGGAGRTASALGGLVRNASPATTRWPRVSVWHGTADRTVGPSNADAVAAQWLDVHGLPSRPSEAGVVDGQSRRVWRDATGEAIVESVTVAGMGHGVPLDVAHGDDEVAGPFMLDVGISSSLHSIRLWGIATASEAAAPIRERVEARPEPQAPQGGWAYTVPPRAPRSGSGAAPLDVGKVINDALRSAGLLR